jgi:CheY-like chemotaxis protein
MLETQGKSTREPEMVTSKAETVLRQYYRVFLVAIAIGLVAIVIFPLQAGSLAQYFSVFATGLLFAAASLALGSLAGFLFGIPYANQTQNNRQTEEAENILPEGQRQLAGERAFRPYRPNTNLEQISDWLTKILVGVGLVQLSQVPDALQTFSQTVAPTLGSWRGSGFFGAAILIYFLVLGFLLLFLWTRVNLPLLYAQSDLDQAAAFWREEGKVDGEKQALEQLVNQYSPVSAPAATRDLGPREAPARKRLLWVDDQPVNNQNEIRVLEDTLPVKVDTSLSTQDALEKLSQTNYALIISDLSRPENRRAGLQLLSQIREGNDYSTPFIIYSRMASAEVEAQAARLRGMSTNSPVKLIEKATTILRG